MSERFCRRLCRYLQALLVVVMVLLGVGSMLVGLAMADPDSNPLAPVLESTKTLDRDLEPVIVTGAQVEAFSGLPANELFVYSYSDGAWRQIPAQVDEVTEAGVYTTTEDGFLDSNDQIAFMAKDLGDQAQDSIPMVDGWPVCIRWYEIAVTDPLSPTQQGWAYLVHSDTLTPTIASDYVRFHGPLRRIETVSYTLGLTSTHPGFEYLALSGSDVNILDRTKVRMYPALPSLWGVKTEDDLGPPPDDELVKDGPVRLIMRKGGIVAYESMVQRTMRIPDLTSPWDNAVRFSTDFSEAASGATFYNGAVPEGATVDGIPDTVRALPFSSWWQLSTDYGTVVHVGETDSIGGTKLNYYLDNSAQDLEDTGDQRSYADVGVRILGPDEPLTYTFRLYFLPNAQPNIGAMYDDFSTHPLSINASLAELAGTALQSEHVRSYTPQEVADASGVPSSRYGAEVYRILYLSQAPLGTPQIVSGLLLVPTRTFPGERFPVLVHGHATTGMADQCAPSGYGPATSRYTATVKGLLEWISNGYLVSATDYVGLGTPGLHPYIVGDAAAYSMLDSARAALRFTDYARGFGVPPADNRIMLEGYSQGGHAALFAHQEWESYAPELDIRGVVAFAPASEMRYLCGQVAAGGIDLLAPVGLAMYSFSEYYGAPESPSAWLQEPYDSELPDQVQTNCIVELGLLYFSKEADEVFQPDLLETIREGRWEDMDPWTGYMDANTPGNYSSSVPVLVLHGENDDIVPIEASTRLLRRLCIRGTQVKLSRYAGVGHVGIEERGRDEALRWMNLRLVGLPAAGSCDEALFHAFIPLIHR